MAPGPTNGQKTINEMIHDDLMYVKRKVDDIVSKLDQKTDKEDHLRLEERLVKQEETNKYILLKIAGLVAGVGGAGEALRRFL